MSSCRRTVQSTRTGTTSQRGSKPDVAWGTVKVGLQVMLHRLTYHGALDGGAAVGQEVDIAALLLHNPAYRHRAHLQDRRILGDLLATQVLHLRRFRRGHHFRRWQLDNTVTSDNADETSQLSTLPPASAYGVCDHCRGQCGRPW